MEPATNQTDIEPDEIENVESRIQDLLNTGFHTKSELIESAIDCFRMNDLGDHPDVPQESDRIVQTLWAEQLRTQSEWLDSEFEDNVKLQAAFDNLARKGIVARMHFMYTQQSADFNIVNEASSTDHGFAYFHAQDTEKAANGFGLIIRFGALNFDDAVTVTVGKQVVEALKNAGLRVRWNGNPDMVIIIKPFKWRRKLPVEN
ncbi:hypothetical protein BDW59DRAFT_107670 [Aspergillus cavernicola]|uniref:DUF6891 domain-containing protein n=1 Tax=Aspergillus cavernicola TaxID=176166 RepID=A0ABR4I383_9EURO